MNDIAKLFRTLTHGVYVIGVREGEHSNAFTAAWVMQVSFDPLLLALSINPHHSSYSMLKKSGVFSVNVLTEDQLDLAAHFGRPSSTNKFKDIRWTEKKAGTPVLLQALSFFECEVSQETPAGDHVVVIGRVINGGFLNPEQRPMNYRDTGGLDGSSRLYPDEF